VATSSTTASSTIDHRKPEPTVSSVVPLLYARREVLRADRASTRTTSSQVIAGTKGGFDRGPDDGDW